MYMGNNIIIDRQEMECEMRRCGLDFSASEHDVMTRFCSGDIEPSVWIRVPIILEDYSLS